MDKDACTIYCGNLHSDVTEELLYELFLQAGPLKNVNIPKEKNFGFVEYEHECSVDYAIRLFQGTALFGQELQLKYRNKNKNPDTNGGRQQPHRMQHHQSLPNMVQHLLPGQSPFLNVYRPPGVGYPPINPTLIQPMNAMLIPPLNMFRPAFPMPVPLQGNLSSFPIPPGEMHISQNSFSNSHHGSSNKRGYHDEHDDRGDCHPPGEKRARNYHSERHQQGASRERSSTYGNDRDSSRGRFHQQSDERHRSRTSGNDYRNDRDGRYNSSHDNNRRHHHHQYY